MKYGIISYGNSAILLPVTSVSDSSEESLVRITSGEVTLDVGPDKLMVIDTNFNSALNIAGGIVGDGVITYYETDKLKKQSETENDPYATIEKKVFYVQSIGKIKCMESYDGCGFPKRNC